MEIIQNQIIVDKIVLYSYSPVDEEGKDNKYQSSAIKSHTVT